MTAVNAVYGKERIVRMWVGMRPIVLLFTPEAVEVSCIHLIYIKMVKVTKRIIFIIMLTICGQFNCMLGIE